MELLWENAIVLLKSQTIKGLVGFKSYHSIAHHLVMLRTTVEECQNNNKIFFVALLTLEKHLTQCPKLTFGID